MAGSKSALPFLFIFFGNHQLAEHLAVAEYSERHK
jgi:hypothetical protein